MFSNMKQQRFIPGAIVRIPIGDGFHTYGRLLIFPYIEIYDYRTMENILDLEAIVSHTVLFTVSSHRSVITKGDWEIVGELPYDEKNAMVPMQFWQDPQDPSKCILMDRFDNKIPATIEECRGLERVSCWEINHIVDRIRDHYSGIPNVWAQQSMVRELGEGG